jgi:hypothetical protein
MSTTTDNLIQSFATTGRIIHMQADGLTHEQMMLQPPFRGNCFNWVLGHISSNRDHALRLLGAEPVFSEAEAALYRTGSDPMTAAETAVDSQRLVQAIDESQARLAAGLGQASAETLNAIYNEERNQTVADRIAGLHWHETYHTGQLELLRQLAGTNDAII